MANKNYSLHLALIMACMVTMTTTVAGMRIMTKTIPRSSCNGTIGECMEAKKKFEIDSESNMEIFESKNKVIGNGALGRNGIPCSKKDNTTKNCRPGTPANRYNRGCSPITRCRGGGGGGGGGHGSTHS
ncbi:rapid alkalinization factor-like [Arachis stenosperma]|uniref:rapid alkalinization factor-like n=1 Tax=Arachis stenosperma TaxID=217475 RepID=UPI0025ACBA87|nr:rapid alkalinization factor-like [Arachis stenosperma]